MSAVDYVILLGLRKLLGICGKHLAHNILNVLPPAVADLKTFC